MDLGAMAKHRCNSGDMSMQNAYDDTHDDEADLTALLPQNLTTSMSLLEAMNGNHPKEAASSGPSMTATHHSPSPSSPYQLPPFLHSLSRSAPLFHHNPKENRPPRKPNRRIKGGNAFSKDPWKSIQQLKNPNEQALGYFQLLYEGNEDLYSSKNSWSAQRRKPLKGCLSARKTTKSVSSMESPVPSMRGQTLVFATPQSSPEKLLTRSRPSVVRFGRTHQTIEYVKDEPIDRRDLVQVNDRPSPFPTKDEESTPTDIQETKDNAAILAPWNMTNTDADVNDESDLVARAVALRRRRRRESHLFSPSQGAPNLLESPSSSLPTPMSKDDDDEDVVMNSDTDASNDSSEQEQQHILAVSTTPPDSPQALHVRMIPLLTVSSFPIYLALLTLRALSHCLFQSRPIPTFGNACCRNTLEKRTIWTRGFISRPWFVPSIK